ncbi:MAG: hypothetical protein VW397_08630 [Candidatus Margulisiibacteriota bacterium]
MIKKIILLGLVSIILHADNLHRPDAHAPIGVMSDHYHKKGEAMLSYRFMTMQMSSLYDGSSMISLETAEQSYTMNPTKMTMNMHMIGTMWGVSDAITFAAMIGYSDNKMTMINKMTNAESEMRASGLNDLKLQSIFKINDERNKFIIGNVGLSIPIGSISESNDTGTHYPYGMQLGSGTYDLLMGTTGVFFHKDFSYGTQINGIFRLTENKYGYSRGNHYKLTSWAQKIWSNELSTSIRTSLSIKNNINGSDNTLTTMQINMSPMYNTKQGNIIADVGVGLNFKPKSLVGSRFASEFIVPIYRRSNAISILTDSTLIFGFQQKI